MWFLFYFPVSLLPNLAFLLVSFPALCYLEMRLTSIGRKNIYIYKTFQFSTNNKKTQSVLRVRKKKCLFLQGRGWPTGTSVIPWPEISPLNFFPSLTLVKMVMGKSTHFYSFSSFHSLLFHKLSFLLRCNCSCPGTWRQVTCLLVIRCVSPLRATSAYDIHPVHV